MNVDALASKRVLYPVLAALVALLAILTLVLATLLTRQPALSSRSAVAGVTPQLVLYGPGVGTTPLFRAPMGAAVGARNRIYVADTGNNRIVVFDRNGRYLFQFGQLGVARPAAGGVASWTPGRFNYPTDVTADEAGNVYVADFNNNQIQKFTADGVFIRAFPDRNRPVGRGSSGEGGGIAVTSLAVKSGKVYATDRFQVVEFDTDGRFIRQFGLPGTSNKSFDHPNGITTINGSDVVVSDSNNARVMNMGTGSAAVWILGAPRGHKAQAAPAELQLPRGIAETDKGELLIADALASQVVRVSAAGRVIARYGKRGEDPGEFNMLTDVASSPDGSVVVADKGNDRVQVLSLTP